ncbi:MAG TPA: TIGR03086 family metal-binding protein [Pseudonocardiaceae bacterium]
MNVIELHRRAVEEFLRYARRIRPDQWHLPTPCVEWDVRTLVNHLVSENRWTVPLLAGATVEEVGDRFDGDLLGENPTAAVLAAAREALAAVDTPGALDGRVHLSYGDEDAKEYLRQLATDHLVHAWDLAVAVEADPRLDAELVAECAAWFTAHEDAYRAAGIIGPRVELPTGASLQDKLLAAFGRDPRWNPVLGAVLRFNAALDRCDVDAVMATMTEDCVFESTGPAPDGRRYEGAAAVRRVWEELFEGTSEPRFEVEELLTCQDRVVQRWRHTWRNPDGSYGSVRGADVFRVRDGKVAEKLSYVKG